MFVINLLSHIKMSDGFIPLNQSTPRGKTYQYENQTNRGYQNNRFHGKNQRGGRNNRWRNDSRNSSYGSESNSSFSQSQDRNNIDAYLHPSMLEDPWARLRQQQQTASSG